MKKIRVLLADDHAYMRLGIRSLFGFQPDMEIVGEANTGAEAVEKAAKLQADVVIMDLVMPDLNGAEATKQITESTPQTKVVIFSSFGNSPEMSSAIANGAAGAILKESSTDELLNAVRTVASGGKAIDPQVAQYLRTATPPPILTQRQSDILESLARGLSNDDIALQFGVSKPRVKQLLNKIYEELGAANRAEAVAIAVRQHLLPN